MGILSKIFGAARPVEPVAEVPPEVVGEVLDALGLRYNNFVRAKHEDLPRLRDALRVLELNRLSIQQARANNQPDWAQRRRQPALEADVAEARAQVAATILGRDEALVWHDWLRRVGGEILPSIPGAEGEGA